MFKKKDVLILAGLLVLNLILRAPSFSFPLDYDVGGHVFWGEQVVKSGFYSVLQELRPVGILAIFALGFRLFALNLIWVPLLGVSFWATSAFVLYRLVKLTTDSERLSWGAALVFSLMTASRAVQGEMVNMETFMAAFSLCGVFYYFRYEKEGGRGSLFRSGLFFGTSFLIKHLAVFDLLPVVLLLALPVLGKLRGRNNPDKEVRVFLGQLYLFSLGFLMPLLLVSLYFLTRGKLAEFYDWQFIKIRSNVAPFHELGNPWKNFWFSFRPILEKTTIFWLLVVGGMAKAASLLKDPLRLFLLFWVLSVFAGMYLLWWFFPHHYLQWLPPLSILAILFGDDVFKSRLDIFYQKVFFVGVVVVGLVQYVVTDPGYYFGFVERLCQRTSREEYLAQAGFDVGPDGWLSFYEAGRYLRDTSSANEPLFAWTSIPFIYTLSGKTPASWYVYKAPLQPEAVLPPNFRGWFPDIDESRTAVLADLARQFPEHILIRVEPEKIFAELFSFSEFSRFVANNYVFDRQFGNILIYEKDHQEVRLSEDKVVPLKIVKSFAAITGVKEGRGQTAVTFEPMVNPGGILRQFEVVYPGSVEITFEPILAEFLGQDEHDLVGWVAKQPSGITDLHFRLDGAAKPISFIRVKMDDITWNNRSYGVNPVLKVVWSSEDVVDLFVESPPDWQGKIFEIYIIYKDGAMSRASLNGKL